MFPEVRAGLKVWPKRWQNLRAIRATELEREFPSHVVTRLCGHSERIATMHYWMTKEGDFERAANLKSVPAGYGKWRNRPQAELTAHEKSPGKQGFVISCDQTRRLQVEDKGREQLPSGCENTAIMSDCVSPMSQSTENLTALASQLRVSVYKRTVALAQSKLQLKSTLATR